MLAGVKSERNTQHSNADAAVACALQPDNFQEFLLRVFRPCR